MAPFAKIYSSYPRNHRVQRALVVAAINGLDVPLVEGFTMAKQHEPEYLSKFPMGKVPGLETPDGFCLAESAAIAAFLAQSGPAAAQLTGGADIRTRAKITEWSAFADWEIGSHAAIPAGMCLFKYMPQDEAGYDRAVAALERGLGRLEVGLTGGNGKFLVGEKLTLADIMVFGPLFFASGFLIDAEMRKKFPAVVEYLTTLAEKPELKNVFGELKLCETRVKW